jgi:hypothetical protein
MLPLKFRATAKQRPATISPTGVAICCKWIISLLANTLHRPAMRGGFFDLSESSLNCSMLILSLSACWSRNDPVPAAQTEFMEKSSTPSVADQDELRVLASHLDNGPYMRIQFPRGVGLGRDLVHGFDPQDLCYELPGGTGDRN